jgi:glycosyltransferase involved in cell wall biosynthesis
MKIAFVSDVAHPWQIGGVATTEATEAAELAKSHEVHFFSMRWPGMEPNFTYKNINYHTYHKISYERLFSHGRRSIRHALIFSINMLKIFGYKFDVVEANAFPYLHLPVVKLYCKLTGCKLIIDVAEIWDKKYWDAYLGKRLSALAFAFVQYFFGSADMYTINSSYEVENKLRALGIGEHRIGGVFAPVLDNEALSKIKRSPTKYRKHGIVFSGRLIKDKRIDEFLKIVNKVASKMPDVTATIIGDGPEEANIRQMIRRMGIEKNVKLKPFYNYDKKSKLYEDIVDSGLFLMMSEREGLSIITLESIALGTPVVLPDYSPIPKEVRDMCVVDAEVELPDKVIEILKSSDKSKYIKHKENLKLFSAARTNEFYGRIFRKLGLE